MIYDTLQILRNKYQVDLQSILIEEVRIGVFETAIKLSNGTYGLATTLVDTNDQCARIRRDASPFTTGNITGQNLNDLFFNANSSSMVETMKVAALNAISSNVLNESNYSIRYNCDPYSLLDLSGAKTISIIGAFKTYIEKLADTYHKWYVVEMNKDALSEQYHDHFIPSTRANDVLPQSDVIIITGFTLVNNTFKDLLPMIPEKCQVALVGPSCSFIPDILFKNKVDIIGSIKLTDPQKVFKLTGESACGFHYFKNNCAEKICLVNV
jgi:uncharacterized protein (DUF4213/DUF364 family)